MFVVDMGMAVWMRVPDIAVRMLVGMYEVGPQQQVKVAEDVPGGS